MVPAWHAGDKIEVLCPCYLVCRFSPLQALKTSSLSRDHTITWRQREYRARSAHRTQTLVPTPCNMEGLHMKGITSRHPSFPTCDPIPAIIYPLISGRYRQCVVSSPNSHGTNHSSHLATPQAARYLPSRMPTEGEPMEAWRCNP